MKSNSTKGRVLAGLAALTFVAAACGGDDDSASTAQPTPAPSTAATSAAPTDAPTATTAASPETTAASPESTAAASTTPAAPKELATAPGFDGTTIRVGSITAMSGVAAVIGTQLAAGQDVFWKYYNEEHGGIAGKYPVEFVVEDNLYDPTTTVQKYNGMKNDIVMLSQVMGTAPTLALLPLLESDNVVAAPASQDALWVREQQLFPIIEPYQIDTINAMDYVMNEGGGQGKTVGAVIQNDVYGEAGLEGLEFAAEQMGFDVAAVARYKVGDQDFTAQVNELKSAGVEIVFAVALPTEFSKILGTAAAGGYAPLWIGQSPAWVDLLLGTPLKDYMTENVLIAAVGPEWGDPEVPAAVEFADRVAKYKPDQTPNYYFSFGYFQAQGAAQLLEKAVELGSLDRDGIVAAMNSIDVLTFEGLAGDYEYGTPEERNPSRVTTIFEVDPEGPFGLNALKYNFSSDAAAAFEFPLSQG
jgi:ABC-type branched-subunit amino acid transport system substrate-binding protein